MHAWTYSYAYPSANSSVYGPFRSDAGDASLTDLTQAINGEYGAISCYERLAQLAPNPKTREQILEIRQDEIRHYQTFTHLYTALSGRQPTPQVTEPCPTDYRDGLDFAFRDEQHTVDAYLEAADRAQNPAVREAFRRAASDEQNHAVWFLYFLSGPASK